MPGIIVGIDGSDHSLRALEWAIGEAAIRQTPLTVTTAIQQPAPGYGGYHVPYLGEEDVIEQARKMAQVETEQALDKAGPGSRPPSVSVQAVSGLPGEALLEAAEGADMLVVGSRGIGGFKRLLLGSVGVQVTHHAHCPVVVIPAEDI
jgi:nucleotide-binding universal stress UspA family protein